MKHLSAMSVTIFTAAQLAITSGCVSQRGFPPEHGITNFDKVDENLYRGAQPNRIGLEYLKTLNVTTVINLRATSDAWDEEAGICRELGMDYVNLPWSPFTPPSAASLQRALDTIAQSQGATFVHCAFGCDRSGLLVACYRIRHGETNDVALNDARMHGLSPILTGLVDYIKTFR